MGFANDKGNAPPDRPGSALSADVSSVPRSPCPKVSLNPTPAGRVFFGSRPAWPFPPALQAATPRRGSLMAVNCEI
ncbi:hypothetical protein CBM2587_A110129 [Cupriavidus taiwanensis]|uniref:Uncharacterized protein n=1 Tax=Cupriavidus taiwanensis TaxID=164546 RepID=A0A375BG82_9BURK|nr:hypothetical protein CBM2587_A110129 [Cupriavidus taiwanensis]